MRQLGWSTAPLSHSQTEQPQKQIRKSFTKLFLMQNFFVLEFRSETLPIFLKTWNPWIELIQIQFPLKSILIFSPENGMMRKFGYFIISPLVFRGTSSGCAWKMEGEGRRGQSWGHDIIHFPLPTHSDLFPDFWSISQERLEKGKGKCD